MPSNDLEEEHSAAEFEEEEEEEDTRADMSDSGTTANQDEQANSVGEVGGGGGSEVQAESTSNEEERLKKTFAMFDLDQSGEISAVEFGTVMRSLGQNPTDEDIESMLKVFLFVLGLLVYVIDERNVIPFSSLPLQTWHLHSNVCIKYSDESAFFSLSTETWMES